LDRLRETRLGPIDAARRQRSRGARAAL